MRSINLIVIHCTATRCDRPYTVQRLEADHKARFGQHGYHYLISRNGDIHALLPESAQGCHAKRYNRCSIGVVYEGGLDARGNPADTRTAEQKQALHSLLKELTRSYPETRILGHRELPRVAKECPCFNASAEYADLQPKGSSHP